MEDVMKYTNSAFRDMVDTEVPLSEWKSDELLNLQWLIMKVIAERLDEIERLQNEQRVFIDRLNLMRTPNETIHPISSFSNRIV